MTLKDVLIKSNKEDFREGIFGQFLTWLLEILNHMVTSNTIDDETTLYFDIHTLEYDNIIPLILLPHKNYSLPAADIHTIDVSSYKTDNACEFPFCEESFYRANHIFNKFFDFSDSIKRNIPSIDPSTSVGIHFRGSDKNFDIDQANPISDEEFIVIIQDFLHKNSNIKCIYCCSDEQLFINKMLDRFGSSYDILQYQQKRANNIDRFGFFRCAKSLPKEQRDKMTIAAFIDMVSLSRCGVIIKTSSALSSFSKIINPETKVYTVSAMKCRWFPAAAVLPYQSDDNKVKRILNRTMMNNQTYL